MSLIQRMRKAREIKVDLESVSFTARRPTDAEAATLFTEKLHNNMAYIAREYVTGWSGITEKSLVPGGGLDPVPFERELWIDWCDDHPEYWGPIYSAVMNAYSEHVEKREEAAKKLTSWLEAETLPGRRSASNDEAIAVSAWNMMGGIDWSALPIVVEYYGITEVDEFICRLIAIRDHQRLQSG